MSNNLMPVGTRVRYTAHLWVKIDTLGTIKKVDAGDPRMPYLVMFDGTPYTLWVEALDLVQHAAKEPTAPMTKSVLKLLREKGALTSMEAQGVLRCRQLPARILELKRLGHKIKTEMKLDATGQKYARYHLQAA